MVILPETSDDDIDRWPLDQRGQGAADAREQAARTPVSVRDMQWAMRDHFEDTPFDMTTGCRSRPVSMCPHRWRPMTFTVEVLSTPT